MKEQLTPKSLESKLRKLLKPKEVDTSEASLLFNAALANDESLSSLLNFHKSKKSWSLYAPFYKLGIHCRDPRPIKQELRGKTRRDLNYVSSMFQANVNETYKRWFGQYPTSLKTTY